MLKHKEPFTLERKVNLLKSVQMIGLLTTMIQHEYDIALVDSKFLNPNINNHSRKIRESAQAIHTSIAEVAFIKDPRFFNEEYATEIDELLTNFVDHSIEDLRALNAAIKKGKESDVPVEVNLGNKVEPS